MDLNKFDEPFSPEDIEWRIQQSGKTRDGKVWAMVLAYVTGNDSNLLIVFYVQIMPDDFVMQLHRF